MRLGLALWVASGLLACASPPTAGGDLPFAPDRRDYLAFRLRHPDLLEPNYLPFMAYRVPVPPPARLMGWQRHLRRGRGAVRGSPERLVFCHWAAQDLPLRVHIEAPSIDPRLEDELRPIAADRYVAAVDRALRIWERDLDGRVAFVRAGPSQPADLTIRMLAREAPETDPDVQVLGATRLRDSCRVLGGDPRSGRLRVHYRVSELRIYVVDQHGLLLPHQVEKVALHEIGHALGMRGHSPIPADLMYPVARDRISPDGLGLEDVNSFLSLYALPNGTLYADPGVPRFPSRPPLLGEGEPELGLAPHVDARHGFELQVPKGWIRIPTPYGVAMVNGVPWDYEASLQVNVHRYDTVAEYLARYGSAHLRDSRILASDSAKVAGRPARRLRLETSGGRVEELSFVESGDGRVLVVIADCPRSLYPRYQPWFAAVLRSLEIVPEQPQGPLPSRDYSPRGGPRSGPGS